MEVINKPYQAEEASQRIDSYLEMLGKDKTISFLNAVPDMDENREPAIPVRVTIVCVAFEFPPKDDGNENRHWKQMVATQALVKEMLMVMMDSTHYCDTIVVGNYIYGIFSTPFKTQIDEMLETLAKINSSKDLVAMKLRVKGIEAPKLKIGADFGAVLRTSITLRENERCFSWNGTRFKLLERMVDQQMNEDKDIVVTERFKQNLKKEYQEYMMPQNENYVANVRNIAIKKWIEEHE